MRLLLALPFFTVLSLGCGGSDKDTSAPDSSADADADSDADADADADSDADTDADSDADADADADEDADDTGGGTSSDDTGGGTSSDDTGEDTVPDDTGDPEALESVVGERWSCRPLFGSDGGSDPGTDPVYVPNTGNLCIITSEVNWKISKGLIEGGDSAVTLRDCIADALRAVDSGVEGEKCVDDSGMTNNDTCWEALASAEKDCGGPEVDVSPEDSDETVPVEAPDEEGAPADGKSPDDESGGSGVLLIKKDGEEVGHAVTAVTSPKPGPEGEWTVRDNEDGCEKAVLTITMAEVETPDPDPDEGTPPDETDPGSDEGTPPDEAAPEPIDDDGKKVCISACTADPVSFDYCCDSLTDDTWCYKGFRKLRERTPPADTEPVEEGGGTTGSAE